jgi:hypothetical protein
MDLLFFEPPNRMNYPAAELRGIKMNFYLINPDAEHRGILLIKMGTDQCKTRFSHTWV